LKKLSKRAKKAVSLNLKIKAGYLSWQPPCSYISSVAKKANSAFFPESIAC
jgi:hypothetical protein